MDSVSGLGPAILGNIQSSHRTNAVGLRDMLNQGINQGGLTWEKLQRLKGTSQSEEKERPGRSEQNTVLLSLHKQY